MEKAAFTRENLSDVRVIMAIMCVLTEELVCQAVMGQISVLKCLLSGAHGRLWSHPVMHSIKWCCFLRSQLQWHLPGTGGLRGLAARGSGVCQAGLRGGDTSGWQTVKTCLPMAIEVRGRFDMDHTRA
jgi:hypothetical protein